MGRRTISNGERRCGDLLFPREDLSALYSVIISFPDLDTLSESPANFPPYSSPLLCFQGGQLFVAGFFAVSLWLHGFRHFPGQLCVFWTVFQCCSGTFFLFLCFSFVFVVIATVLVGSAPSKGVAYDFAVGVWDSLFADQV